MDNEQFQEFVVRHLMKLTEDMSSTKGTVSSLKGTASSLKDTVSSLKDTVSSLESRLSVVESAVLRIETRMENEIIDKIKILFDVHQQHEARLERVEKRLGITGT